MIAWCIKTTGMTNELLVSSPQMENILELFLVTVRAIFWICLFFLLLFNYSCMPFLPFPPPIPAEPTSLPYPHHPPQFCPCVLYNSSCNSLVPPSPPHTHLTTTRQFPPSMFLVVFCLLFSFVDYVAVKGEIIWYLSLTAWLISLSIMLSSFIHAVAKGISSFFLSAA